jgi:uncharacterized paraquat-inducible protein A
MFPHLFIIFLSSLTIFSGGCATAVKRRESFLMALDALGKWSLIDAYVLVLMMVAFHFHITQPGKDQPQVRLIRDHYITTGGPHEY